MTTTTTMEALLEEVKAGTADPTPLKKLEIRGKKPTVYIKDGFCVGYFDRTTKEGKKGARFVGKDMERFREILRAARTRTDDPNLKGLIVVKNAVGICRRNTEEKEDKTRILKGDKPEIVVVEE